ncbi:hypothetical protein BDP55DRAFT_725626 [Colletotrichum godetiae]|uniref:Ankyrin repeat protein n=1 Tax=Colletotrichum godetiae TaxID=1209918 RepID=A0AAJ0F1E5_9PEZI|nr:uncharacterized protein BDP55DRAFT_725626 [Colletotrichum godetiae]KAK1689458.1 hypothetical protein BDP55DRAFT_725626 [Colletotrichum godetiae]
MQRKRNSKIPSGQGVDVALSKACFTTPLHLATKGGHCDTVQWLLGQHSVDMEVPARFLCPAVVSAVQSAAFSGNKPTITKLVQRMGVDINKRVEEGGATPLYYALAAYNAQSVALLRSLGAKPEQSFVSDVCNVNYENALELVLAIEKTDPITNIF